MAAVAVVLVVMVVIVVVPNSYIVIAIPYHPHGPRILMVQV